MLHHWYPQPNFTAAELVFEKEHRFLQPVWDYIKDGNEHILSSPLFPPFYALSIDYAFVAVFTFIDLVLCDVPFFKNHKIQKDRKVTWDLIKKSLFLQMWNQLLWIYPLALVQLIWVPPIHLPPLAPTVFEFVTQLAFCFLAFDFSYFWFHFLFHKVKFLYRWCHSVHHMYSSPFAAAAQHLHPFELFFVGTFITGKPLTCFEPWFNYLDRLMGYHITYEDLKKMAEEKSKRFGLYNKEEEKGLEKIN
ncbi:unnamed protein product, partial [Mesorhabditis spiculigera]